MYNIIDWLSFTVHVGDHDDKTWFSKVIFDELEKLLGDAWKGMYKPEESWDIQGGRTPYQASYYSKDGFRIYFGKPEHILVEIEAQGCDTLRDLGIMMQFLGHVTNNVTRIDIACDMDTQTTPMEFVEAGYSKRFRSASFVSSQTGDTIYIGSRKSVRYARVYKYNHPHPRSRYLRCEMVFRQQEAKNMAKRIVTNNMNDVVATSGEIFEWEHGDWKPDGKVFDMTTYRPERRNAKTVRWLISQVSPAFIRLVKEGTIENPVEFLIEYFLEGERDGWL